jgi:hypothetical protein
VDQDLVAPLLDRMMTWIEDGVPVETIATRIRHHLLDPRDCVRLIKELRQRARSLWTHNRLGPGPASRADRRGDGAAAGCVAEAVASRDAMAFERGDVW